MAEELDTRGRMSTQSLSEGQRGELGRLEGRGTVSEWERGKLQAWRTSTPEDSEDHQRVTELLARADSHQASTGQQETTTNADQVADDILSRLRWPT